MNAQWLMLGLILLIALIALLAATLFMMTRMLLSPSRMSDGKAMYVLKRLSPGDLELPFHPVAFQVKDEQTNKPLKLAGWWIPHPHARGKCVVLIHGYGDAKVGAIAWAPLWHSLGYHILAVDLRAHGESQGRTTTGGFYERHDLNQVLNELRARRPGDTGRLVLFGVSLGAAVALAAAETRDDISAVICESPFADYSDAVLAHAQAQNMPGAGLVPLVLWIAQRFSGARFSEVRPVDLIARVTCPVLVIDSQADRFASPSASAGLAKAVLGRQDGVSAYWSIPHADHVMGLAGDPAGYHQRIANFLQTVAETATTP